MFKYFGKTATGGKHYILDKAMQFPEGPEEPFMDKASAALRKVREDASKKYGYGRDNLRNRQQMISAEGDKQLEAAKRELSGEGLRAATNRLHVLINVLMRTA